ncbi:MAG TPA: hypothetical protein VJT32_00375 [bacterium]|nr:hypothetical protein [bacterium]
MRGDAARDDHDLCLDDQSAGQPGHRRQHRDERGRRRWTIENQGFNLQKTSELNLEHAYSTAPDRIKAYYYLLQIAHMILQLLEQGSLLRQLAQRQGKTSRALFSSLKNIARRLLDDLRHRVLPEETRLAIQIRFDTS